MPQRIAIVGAGLAGTSCAQALCAAGHTVHLFEASGQIAHEASGNWAGAMHPHVTAANSTLSQLSTQGCTRSLQVLANLTEQGWLQKNQDWGNPGHVQIIAPHKAAKAQAALVKGQWPTDIARWSQTGEHIQSPWPGYFFPQGAWVKPKRWAQANVQACGQQLHLHLNHPINNQALQALQNQFDWVVLASAQHSLALLGLPWQALHGVAGLVKGQVTRVQLAKWENGQLARLPYVLSGQTYAICPPQADWMLIGATYEHPEVGAESGQAQATQDAQGLANGLLNPLNTTPIPHAAANAENLQRFKDCLPGWPLGPVLDARAAWRFVWHDKLPLVGAVDTQAWAALRERVQKDENLSKGSGGTTAPSAPPNLSRILLCTAFASRGLSWAGLVGDIIASHVAGYAPSHPLLASLSLQPYRLR